MADGIKERISEISIIEEIQDSYLTYAMSVIMARALPDVRDGLKPSQRRILVAMNDLNLGPRSQHRKCATIVGDCMGKYHPHGDQAIYPTLVRLAQPWNMRRTLVDGQGNFGSLDGDPAAAMRYTEARMSAAAAAMLEDLDLETVDFEPNFDSTREEPTVLPSRFPNLLINGSSGIAVGMATNLLPHNVGEVCDGIIAVIDNPQITIAELLEKIPGPDLPTGGQICGRQGIYDAYTTGRGTITVRGRYTVEERRGGRRVIVITEIPYQVLRSTVVEKTASLIKDGTIKDASSVNDASDRKNPVRIEVELRKDGNEDVVINQLFRYSPLQSNLNVMNVALVDRRPRTLTLREMIDLFIDHRKEVIRRRTALLLRRAKQRAHVLEGLILAVGDIDEIIQIIRRSPDPETARQRLMDRDLLLSGHELLRRLLPAVFVERYSAQAHNLTAVQANAILAMQLQRLTGLEIEKLATEYAKLVEEIEGYEAILRDERLVLDIIREDLYEIKEKFGDRRRTEITGAVEDFRIEELVPDEQVVVTISHEGYIKRVDVDSYRKQGRGGRGVRGGETREGDFLEHLFVVSTHDYLLFFTNRGRVYWARVFDLPAAGRTARGRSIANLLKFLPNEAYKAVLPVREFEESFVFFATANGTVKKTPLRAFSRPRPSGIIAITLDADDSLVGVEQTSGEDEIVLGSRDGMAVRFNEADVRAMGRSARGVRGMKLRAADRVVSLVAIRPGQSLLTVCEFGFGKRTDIEEYRLSHRGAQGVINIRTTERNGHVVGLLSVEDTDELMMITAKGIMLRTDLSNVREIGRATQGVRLIRVDEGDKVVAVARIAPENGDEADGERRDTTAPTNGDTPAEAAFDNAGSADETSDSPPADGAESSGSHEST